MTGVWYIHIAVKTLYPKVLANIILPGQYMLIFWQTFNNILMW